MSEQNCHDYCSHCKKTPADTMPRRKHPERIAATQPGHPSNPTSNNSKGEQG